LLLNRSQYPFLENWSILYLIGLALPFAGVLATVFAMGRSARFQRIYLQLLGVVMCYSAFSDTDYIFHYPGLPNGLYSDTRVLAGLLAGGPENVGYPFFFLIAASVATVNAGVLIWGFLTAFRELAPAKD
jgi:hypothetical protein